MADLSRRQVLGGTAAVMAMFAGLSVPSVVSAQPRQANGPLLLTNLQLFDGSGSAVQSGVSVRIEEGRIHSILPADATAEGAEVFDCGGRLLMPGLIDAHWHTTLAAITQTTAMTADVGYIHLVAAQEAKRTLMRGVTSVRDVGGPSFALQRAINEGIVDGPRIFPAGAMISQTSGHGDFRMRHDIPRGSTTPLSEQEHQGVAAIADGEDEVLRRTREQLMLGASQIKLMAGGGVASLYDPLDSTQFTERELRAAVDAADWPEVTETSTSLVSTFLQIDLVAASVDTLLDRLHDLLATRDWYTSDLPTGRRLWHVPTVYGTDLAPQLEEAAELAGLDPDAAIAQLSQARVRVLTIGFAPGQPYMGELPQNWDIPRQQGLTKSVPAGALIVAIRQLIIFTNASPTGWRHIGQTAFKTFRPRSDTPFALSPGDELCFPSISRAEYDKITATDETGQGGAETEVLA